MMQYPRVTPEGEIKCRPDCESVFYDAAGLGRRFVIGCQNRECGHKGFVRAITPEETENLWRDHLNRVEA